MMWDSHYGFKCSSVRMFRNTLMIKYWNSAYERQCQLWIELKTNRWKKKIAARIQHEKTTFIHYYIKFVLRQYVGWENVWITCFQNILRGHWRMKWNCFWRKGNFGRGLSKKGRQDPEPGLQSKRAGASKQYHFKRILFSNLRKEG